MHDAQSTRIGPSRRRRCEGGIKRPPPPPRRQGQSQHELNNALCITDNIALSCRRQPRDRRAEHSRGECMHGMRMKSSWRGAVSASLPVFVAAALLAGCGGTSSSSSTSAGASTSASSAASASTGSTADSGSSASAMKAAQQIVTLAETKLLYGPTTGPATASQLHAPTDADIQVFPYKPSGSKSIVFVSCSAESGQCTHSAEIGKALPRQAGSQVDGRAVQLHPRRQPAGDEYRALAQAERNHHLGDCPGHDRTADRHRQVGRYSGARRLWHRADRRREPQCLRPAGIESVPDRRCGRTDRSARRARAASRGCPLRSSPSSRSTPARASSRARAARAP